MIDTQPLYDLLRTNSINQFLVRRSQNRYVGILRQVLNELGFGRELQWDRLRADHFFGEETVLAVRAFAQRNRFNSDGLAVSPQMLIRIIQRYDTIEGIQMMQQGIQSDTLSATFNPTDVNNYGAQQLVSIMQSLGRFESDLPEALRQYAMVQGLFFEDGTRLTPNLARAILADLLPSYGDQFVLNQNNNTQPVSPPIEPVDPPPQPPVITPVDPLPSKELDIIENTRSVSVSDGDIQIDFRKRDRGVYTIGFHPVSNFVNEHSNKLFDLELTNQTIGVVEAVARNEGNLDAVNTYDGGFVSLGIFQWTMGRDDRAGELAALLKKVKTYYPHTFRIFFQTFGIDVAADTNTTYGYLTYNGRLINSTFMKNQFREPEWAFRFWRAAQNLDVQSIEIMHALSRLRNFYWKDNYRVLNYGLNEVITSSYGVALLLDNHVNRPAWVAKCIEQAMINTGLTTNPQFWSDTDEGRLIESYLDVRAVYSENGVAPMTKARDRARNVLADARSGRLSTARGSFQVSEMALRSYSDTHPDAPTPSLVLPPPFYAQEDYPDIEMDIEE